MLRFASFSLHRYGNFSEQQLILPTPTDKGPDLHLILGRNEAGKSVMRTGLVDFLFGIRAQSKMAFVHSYADMKLCAKLIIGNQALELCRHKGNKGTLRLATGQIFDETELASALGQIDRDKYEAGFALDHELLRKGGRELLSRDLGSVFYDAASGMRSVVARRAALVQNLRVLGSPALPRLKKTRLRELKGELNHCNEQLATQESLLEEFSQNRAAVNLCREQLATQEQQLKTLNKRQAGLTKLIRGAELEQQNKQLKTELAGICGSAEFPSGPAGLALVLQHSYAIDKLQQQALHSQHHESELARLQDSIADLHSSARELAAILGWQDPSQADLDQIRLRTSELAAINELSAQYDDRTRIRQLQQATVTELRARAAGPSLNQVHPIDHAALDQALDKTRAFGDWAARRLDFSKRVAERKQFIATELAGLAPWAGTPAQLRDLTPAPAGEIKALEQEFEQACGQLRAARAARAHNLRAQRRDQKAQANLSAQHDLVLASHLEVQRTAREQAYQQLRQAGFQVREAEEKYLAAVATADRLADARFSKATQIAAYEARARALDEGHKRELELQRQLSSATAAQQVARNRRAACFDAAGLEPMAASTYDAWLATRARALAHQEQFDRIEAEQQAWEDELHATLSALRAQLPSPPGDNRSLVPTAELLLRTDREREANATSARLREEQIKAATVQTATTTRIQESLAQQLQARLGQFCPAGAQLADWYLGLSKLQPLMAKLQEAKCIEREQVNPKRRSLQAFVAQAENLRLQLAPELASSAAATSIAAELKSRRDDALSRKARMDELRGRQEDLRTQIDKLVATADDKSAFYSAISAPEATERLPIEERANQEKIDLAHATIAQLTERIETATSNMAKKEKAGTAGAAVPAQRERVVTALTQAGSEGIATTIALELLNNALELFQREKSSSAMLSLASRLFATLTLGRYPRLHLDHEQSLEAVAAAGRPKTPPEMSDGTRDQLYLALRLAGLLSDLPSTRARQLPFIADDLFVNYDDLRAAAGFRVLAELAGHTQVIYLSHHDHLADVARGGAPGLQVHRLGPN